MWYVPEYFRKQNWKTVFSRDIQGEILHKKTVFQFFSFVSGNVPEEFRKQNWKTEKLFFPERSRERFSVKKQFFSFLVLSPEMFRKSSVSKTEKLKNCFFYGESLPGSLWKKTVVFTVFHAHFGL